MLSLYKNHNFSNTY